MGEITIRQAQAKSWRRHRMGLSKGTIWYAGETGGQEEEFTEATAN